MPVVRVSAEVEVKLEATAPETLDQIGALRGLAGYRLRPRRAEQLHTIYLDTADLALARSGVAMRLRRGPDGWEATVKWTGRVAGAIHERPELNLTLPGRPRLPFVLPPGPLHTQLAATVLDRPLTPILVSDVHRRLLDLLPARAGARARPLAEVALDLVRLRAPGGPLLGPPYCEIEIEQRAGHRADLSAASRALQERFGLLPSRSSKFARGMAALHGRAARPRAEQALRATDPLAIAVRTVLAGQLVRLRESDPGTRIGEDPEALHHMRVAVRRLRAALRTFGGVLRGRAGAGLARELRWLGRELGAVRDLDVQLANLDWHRARLDPAARGHLDALRRHMRRERAGRREALLAVLDSARYLRLIGRLERHALDESLRPATALAREPVAAVGRRAVKKALRRLRARGDAMGDLPDAADLHALRIRAKRLRYCLEALKPITGSAGRKLIKHLVRVQDLLGRFNDAMVAADSIRGYAHRAAAAGRAPARQILERLADTELQRAGAAQAEFRRAWTRFRSKRVRRLGKTLLAALKDAGRGAGTDTAPVRKEGGA